MLLLMRLLARAKRLRGTPLDPFGWLPERRLERRLISEYEDTLEEILSGLTPANHEIACRLAALPDEMRGFDELKAERVQAARQRASRLLASFRRPEEAADPDQGE